MYILIVQILECLWSPRIHGLWPNIDLLRTNFGGPLLLPDTDSSSVNFCVFPSDLGLQESTVGVALGSHIAERKRARADGVRNWVFYSNVFETPHNKIRSQFTRRIEARLPFRTHVHTLGPWNSRVICLSLIQ